MPTWRRPARHSWHCAASLQRPKVKMFLWWERIVRLCSTQFLSRGRFWRMLPGIYTPLSLARRRFIKIEGAWPAAAPKLIMRVSNALLGCAASPLYLHSRTRRAHDIGCVFISCCSTPGPLRKNGGRKSSRACPMVSRGFKSGSRYSWDPLSLSNRIMRFDLGK
jgi:hypothetical protein